MKHLREYVRQILLTEAAKGPADLPDDIFVQIKADDDFAEFNFVKKDTNSLDDKPIYSPSGEESYWTDAAIDSDGRVGGGIYGNIQLYSVEESEVGPCSNAFMISWSGATSGYGPMLYDLAMEWATANGGGLIADRGSVSPEAKAVWDYYLNNRSDIEIVQLDDANNKLTDTEEDNCDQQIAGGQNYRYPRPRHRIDPEWPKSSLSKMYRKPNNAVTKQLKALGKLV